MQTIHTKKQFAKQAGVSVRHLERLLAAGEGPPIVQLGVRRKGIADDDGETWLRSRRRVPPGFREGGAS
jgi:hypothetical protein